MPTYEYRCKDCGQHLEVVQAFTDDSLTECPACNGALKKVFGSIGITFKGSGFYKTDSRGGSKGATKTAEPGTGGGESGESGGGSGGSGDKATPSTGDSSTKESASNGSSGSGSSGSTTAAPPAAKSA